MRWITVRPSVKSKVPFNGHICLVEGLDDETTIEYVLLCSLETTDINDNPLVEVDPQIWQILEEMHTDLTFVQGTGCRFTAQGLQDPYLHAVA